MSDPITPEPSRFLFELPDNVGEMSDAELDALADRIYSRILGTPSE